jgi:hypothetical protein
MEGVHVELPFWRCSRDWYQSVSILQFGHCGGRGWPGVLSCACLAGGLAGSHPNTTFRLGRTDMPCSVFVGGNN